MRRVRCDLKDLPFTSAVPHPPCSNCKERGLKCIDEFADVKAVKLLRRGRRLQQVEAIYGKTVKSDGASSPSSPPATRLSSIIPHLKPEFFSSPFWRWFSTQRPVLDPVEFRTRFMAHAKGTHSLGHEGGLIAMILVVWAASFGLDEYGVSEGEHASHAVGEPDIHAATVSTKTVKKEENERVSDNKNKNITVSRNKERKEKTDAMLREILELIDFHGVMRRPTWDGVRALLLIMPLMEEAHPLERLAMYEAALSQTQALCTIASSSAGPSSLIPSFPHGSDDAAIRARIFWYAHMQEGISTGMRGGRLVLDNDDLDLFQSTVPPCSMGGSSSPTTPPDSSGLNCSPSPSPCYLQVTQLLSIPVQLGIACRKVHAVLTGPKASRRADEHGLVDAHGMREIWEDLDHCWREFDSLRRLSMNELPALDVEEFTSAWQIFIFECHNIIRESLKQCMSNSPSSDPGLFSGSSPPRPSSHSSNSSPYLSPHHLHAIATRQCLSLLPSVLRIIKYHLQDGHSTQRLGFFQWDAGLIRDGCFFAGFLAASVEGDIIDISVQERNEDGGQGHLTVEEGVGLCLAALKEMRWAFSKSEEREETVRMIWENRKIGRHGRPTFDGRHNLSRLNLGRLGSDTYPVHQVGSAFGKPVPSVSHVAANSFMPLSLHNLDDRPQLPPIHLLYSPRRVESAPATAYSTDGHGANGWPSYTPPGTATSVATSAGTGVSSVSSRGSPVFANLPTPITFKGEVHDQFYHVAGDLEQFSFNVPVAATGINDISAIGSIAHYHHRSHSPGSMHSSATPAYLDSGVFRTSGSTLLPSNGDPTVCPQFNEDCNGYYH